MQHIVQTLGIEEWSFQWGKLLAGDPVGNWIPHRDRCQNEVSAPGFQVWSFLTQRQLVAVFLPVLPLAESFLPTYLCVCIHNTSSGWAGMLKALLSTQDPHRPLLQAPVAQFVSRRLAASLAAYMALCRRKHIINVVYLKEGKALGLLWSPVNLLSERPGYKSFPSQHVPPW